MIPIVIGGIALAATGYGVKKYLENEENVDKLYDVALKAEEKVLDFVQDVDLFFSSSNTNGKEEVTLQGRATYFADTLQALYSGQFQKLKVALRQFENLEKEFVCSSLINDISNETQYVSMESIDSLNRYEKVLRKTKKYLKKNLKRLYEIASKESSFANLNGEDKKTVNSFIKINNLLEKIFFSEESIDERVDKNEYEKLYKQLTKVVK